MGGTCGVVSAGGSVDPQRVARMSATLVHRGRDKLRRHGFLQPEAVRRVLDDHVAGREDLSRQLWGLLA